MKNKLFIFAIALGIFFIGFAEPIFGVNDKHRSESKVSNDHSTLLVPAEEELLGTWVFYGLQELDAESGDVLGSYHAFTFYEFGENHKVKIEGSIFNWDRIPEEGIIDIGGIQFSLVKYRQNKMVLKDGDQLYFFGKLDDEE